LDEQALGVNQDFGLTYDCSLRVRVRSWAFEIGIAVVSAAENMLIVGVRDRIRIIGRESRHIALLA
jgi:hypothetical protein